MKLTASAHETIQQYSTVLGQQSSDGDGLRLQRANLWMAAMRLRWLALARTSSGEVGQVAVHLRAGIVRAGENARRASIVERLRAAVSVD